MKKAIELERFKELTEVGRYALDRYLIKKTYPIYPNNFSLILEFFETSGQLLKDIRQNEGGYTWKIRLNGVSEVFEDEEMINALFEAMVFYLNSRDEVLEDLEKEVI